MPKRSGPLAPGVAFITGGARGLGNAIAVSFAKEGARGVVIVDIQDEETFKDGQKAVEDVGTECLAIRADVTKEADIERAVNEAVEKFGRIDYAANFAGIGGPSTLITETTLEGWQKCIDVNCNGVLLSTKHELLQMMKQDSIPGIEPGRPPQCGSIVNCASMNSVMSFPTSGAYTASKHAVAGLTKTAALEARAHNIRVNAVSPGFLRTQLVEPLIKEASGKGEEVWSQFEKRQGRRATFEEIGDAVVVLCSPRCSLVNGANLMVDGGFTVNEGND